MQVRLLQVFRHRMTRLSCLRIYLCSVPEDWTRSTTFVTVIVARSWYLVRSLHVCSYHHVATANKASIDYSRGIYLLPLMNKKAA